MSYRAAILGCGRIGCGFSDDPGASAFGVTTHAEAYTACPRTHLVAVADVDPERARRCAERWGVPASYDDPIRLLREQRPEVVSVCTPDPTHFQLVRDALLTDGVRAVLAEKPLATTTGEARQLIDLAERRRSVLAVNYTRRYSPVHARVRDLVRDGVLGDVELVRGLYTKGTAHNGTHWFDLVRFLVGDVAVVRATDRLGEPSDDPTLDVELSIDRGARAVLHARPAASYTVFEMDIHGTEGRVTLSGSGNVIEWFRAVEGLPHAGYRGLVLQERVEGGLRDLALRAVEDLVACLETGRRPCCTAEDGHRALQVALAARESCRLGGAPVELHGDRP